MRIPAFDWLESNIVEIHSEIPPFSVFKFLLTDEITTFITFRTNLLCKSKIYANRKIIKNVLYTRIFLLLHRCYIILLILCFIRYLDSLTRFFYIGNALIYIIIKIIKIIKKNLTNGIVTMRNRVDEIYDSCIAR